MKKAIITLISLLALTASAQAAPPELLQTIPLAQPVSNEGAGSIFAHDLNGDGNLDLLVTTQGYVGAYEITGETLWAVKYEIKFFDQYHHPSLIAGDMDGDGAEEVACLTPSNNLVIAEGASGTLKKEMDIPGNPKSMSIANLRGLGERDIILEYSQTHLRAICADDAKLLWETDKYKGIEHSPLKVMDLDGDGLDEVAGASIIDHDGKRMNEWDLGDAYRSMDSLTVADIVPGGELEIALAEQRGGNSHTDVVTSKAIVFRALNPWNWEDPDKLAVGDFDPERPGLEIFNRSSGGDGTTPRGKEEPYKYEEAPWVLDATGELISKYYINDHKPEWWTGHGIEVINRIDWDGDGRDEIAAKERHKDGACAIINPITGKFLKIFKTKALRMYVADVIGDYREEIVVLDQDGTIKIFGDTSTEPTIHRTRYWDQQHYRRQKQNWNYYSP